MESKRDSAEEEKNIKEKLKLLVRATNYHRSPEVRQAVLQFEADLDKQTIPKILMPFFTSFAQMGDTGAKRRLSKMKPYAKYYAKLHLHSPKAGSAHGVHRGKQAVHLSKETKEINDPSKDKINSQISIFLHESIHYAIAQAYENDKGIPVPEEEWKSLAALIQQDIDEIDKSGQASIYEIIVLDKKKSPTYDNERWVAEIAPRLAEFILATGKLPTAEEGFKRSEKAIEKLFCQMVNHIDFQTKKTLENVVAEKKSMVSATQVYQMISTQPYDLTRLPDKNILRSMGIFPLHIAISEGNIALANKLIEDKQFDINTPDKFGNTPLDCAFEFRQNPKTNELLEILIKHGADFSKTRAYRQDADRAIEMIKILYKNNLINLTNAFSTMLKNKHFDTSHVNWFLKQDLNLNNYDENGRSILSNAYLFKPFIIPKLLRRAGANAIDRTSIESQAILISAARDVVNGVQGSAQCLKEFVAAGFKLFDSSYRASESNIEILREALLKKDIEIIHLLLQAGFDFNNIAIELSEERRQRLGPDVMISGSVTNLAIAEKLFSGEEVAGFKKIALKAQEEIEARLASLKPLEVKEKKELKAEEKIPPIELPESKEKSEPKKVEVKLNFQDLAGGLHHLLSRVLSTYHQKNKKNKQTELLNKCLRRLQEAPEEVEKLFPLIVKIALQKNRSFSLSSESPMAQLLVARLNESQYSNIVKCFFKESESQPISYEVLQKKFPDPPVQSGSFFSKKTMALNNIEKQLDELMTSKTASFPPH